MDIPLYMTLSACLLLILNGIIVLDESAMESVSRSKLKQKLTEEEGNSKGKAEKLARLLDRPTRSKLTNRLLITAFAAAGTLLIWNAAASEILWRRSLLLVIYLACYVAFGFLFPFKIGRQHSESLSLKFIGMQTILNGLLLPVTALLSLAANLFLRIFRQDTNVDESEFSEEDVMSMLEEGQESGAIMEEGRRMIGSIFRFDDELAYEIMTPRTDVFMIDLSDEPSEYMDEFLELRYSRVPVCEDESDNIIGILNIKDYMMKAVSVGFENVEIRDILREPIFVPETKKIASLFMELQQANQHIAVLIDEYGGFSGIVTMEDIIEEIVGDISDEYDEAEDVITKIDQNTYLVDGTVSLDDLNEDTGSGLKSENSETIGGYIIDLIGEIPKDGYVNRTIESEGYRFTILSVQERRIEKVKFEILTPAEQSEEDEEEK